ncbi:MAG: exosortase O [Myxococcales bacterium]
MLLEVHTPPLHARQRLTAVGARAAALLLPATWFVLQAPVLSWLWRHLPSEEYFSSLALLAVAAVPVARATLRERRSTPWTLTATPAAVALLLASAVASLAADALWDVDLLASVLFGVGTYALYGLYVSRARWRSALPAALLLIATLPFGHHLHSYLGFPARLAVASIVHEGFQAIGIPSLTAQTVLQLETGAMNVDLPCSGIRSAWTGLVFFLGATCLLRTRLGLRWAGAGASTLSLLFLANVLRVAVLALLSHVGQGALARLVHEPLGVAGFVLCCSAGYGMLRRIGATTTTTTTTERSPPTPAPRLLAPALTIALLALALMRPAAAAPAPAAASLEIALPESLPSSPLSLSEVERDLFSRHGARAQKLRLEGALPGTLVIVQSRSWRSHHPPEQCLRGSGRTLVSDVPVVLASGLPVRLIRLADGSAAVWWFQSPTGSTNELLQRVWAELRGRESRWTLVSLVLDSLPADTRGLEPLTSTLSAAVDQLPARSP